MSSNEKPTHQRIFSITTFCLSAISLFADILGIGKFAFDIIVAGNLDNVIFKFLVLTLVFIFGVGLGIISMKGFGNMTLPAIASLYAWVYLGITCISYLGMTMVLNTQSYSFGTFLSFVLVMIAELMAIAGLHVVIENHDIRLFSIPIFVVSLLQLILIVYKYVFAGAPVYLNLAGELFFFIPMTLVGSAMLGDVGFISLISRIIEGSTPPTTPRKR